MLCAGNHVYIPYFVLVLFIVGSRADIMGMKTSVCFCVQKTNNITVFNEFRGCEIYCIHLFNDPHILFIHMRIDSDLLFCNSRVWVCMLCSKSWLLTFASTGILVWMRVQITTAIGQVIHGNFGTVHNVYTWFSLNHGCLSDSLTYLLGLIWGTCVLSMRSGIQQTWQHRLFLTMEACRNGAWIIQCRWLMEPQSSKQREQRNALQIYTTIDSF